MSGQVVLRCLGLTIPLILIAESKRDTSPPPASLHEVYQVEQVMSISSVPDPLWVSEAAFYPEIDRVIVTNHGLDTRVYELRTGRRVLRFKNPKGFHFDQVIPTKDGLLWVRPPEGGGKLTLRASIIGINGQILRELTWEFKKHPRYYPDEAAVLCDGRWVISYRNYYDFWYIVLYDTQRQTLTYLSDEDSPEFSVLDRRYELTDGASCYADSVVFGLPIHSGIRQRMDVTFGDYDVYSNWPISHLLFEYNSKTKVFRVRRAFSEIDYERKRWPYRFLTKDGKMVIIEKEPEPSLKITATDIDEKETLWTRRIPLSSPASQIRSVLDYNDTTGRVAILTPDIFIVLSDRGNILHRIPISSLRLQRDEGTLYRTDVICAYAHDGSNSPRKNYDPDPRCLLLEENRWVRYERLTTQEDEFTSPGPVFLLSKTHILLGNPLRLMRITGNNLSFELWFYPPQPTDDAYDWRRNFLRTPDGSPYLTYIKTDKGRPQVIWSPLLEANRQVRLQTGFLPSRSATEQRLIFPSQNLVIPWDDKHFLVSDYQFGGVSGPTGQFPYVVFHRVRITDGKPIAVHGPFSLPIARLVAGGAIGDFIVVFGTSDYHSGRINKVAYLINERARTIRTVELACAQPRITPLRRANAFLILCSEARQWRLFRLNLDGSLRPLVACEDNCSLSSVAHWDVLPDGTIWLITRERDTGSGVLYHMKPKRSEFFR